MPSHPSLNVSEEDDNYPEWQPRARRSRKRGSNICRVYRFIVDENEMNESLRFEKENISHSFRNSGVPFKEFIERYSMRKSILSYTYRLEDTSISQLLHNLILVEEPWTSRVVWLYAPNELRRTGHHLL